MIRLALSLTILMLLTGCADLFYRRTFIDEMERESDGFFIAGRDFPMTQGDAGEAYRSRDEIMKRTPLTRRQQERMQYQDSLSYELAKKVDALSPREREIYLRRKSAFTTNSEKIYYLNLPEVERVDYYRLKLGEQRKDRGGYDVGPASVASRGIASQDDHLMAFREPTSIQLKEGMSKRQVIEMWGRPHRVEVAGDPRNQNERWSFVIAGNVSQIYFENGRVEGWYID